MTKQEYIDQIRYEYTRGLIDYSDFHKEMDKINECLWIN